ncbi:DUF2752 domain-containing protein [Pseudokineococcus sp. 1T1Z-3]|uniref:DUF2752 domain-containing protein n=1 Tax=Pseudokineococcus sp. 1T1Z-3 TaxID=3132745 RepID=UPI00309D9722
MALRDPHVPGSWVTCPFLLVTGLPCPGCGGLRAVHDLVSGQVAAALVSNALVVVLLVGAVAVWATWTAAAIRRRPLRLVDAVTGRHAVLLAASLVTFTVLRWVPGLEWLRP